jgi:YidC/Oxa1 family membrane protein insertase
LKILLKKISNFFSSWRGLISIKKLLKLGVRIAFYSEGNAYRAFLEPVVNELTRGLNLEICYLTSDPDDIFLDKPPYNVKPIYIGWGSAMIFAFQTLRFNVLVTTMPDLNSFHIKRSVHPVHYIYLQHSLVSSHMVYRTGAFDHFDSIFCAGPHQIAEIREWEAINNLEAKELYEHGYAPLETIMQGFESHLRLSPSPPPNKSCRILVAPSWGPEGIIDRGAAPLIENLLVAGHQVILRIHPQSIKTSFTKIEELKKTFILYPNFKVDQDTSTFETLYDVDVLVSDWSGIALEYGLGLERPVIFVDVPRKVNNPRYT